MSNSFNKLNPGELERLAVLLEELGEAQQAIGKILRHGYDTYNPLLEPDSDGNPVTCNREDLEKELGDILCAIDLMNAARDIRRGVIELRADQKREKISGWLHHQHHLL